MLSSAALQVAGVTSHIRAPYLRSNVHTLQTRSDVLYGCARTQAVTDACQGDRRRSMHALAHTHVRSECEVRMRTGVTCVRLSRGKHACLQATMSTRPPHTLCKAAMIGCECLPSRASMSGGSTSRAPKRIKYSCSRCRCGCEASTSVPCTDESPGLLPAQAAFPPHNAG